MKTLPSGLAAHIAGGTTTLADLLKITRTDGQVFAFTSAADDVTISSVLYKSAQGLNISSLEASAGLNVDNLELSTLDDGTVFTKLDVLSGRWRNADFVISRYNWANPADGVDVRMVGTVGEVRLHRGYVTAELRGLQQYLQQPIGSVSSKTCRARLGDALCTKDLTAFTYLAEVSAVTSNQVFSVIDPGSGGGDTDYASVSLLLHGDGTDGSTTIIDNAPTPKTVTCFGNAKISTTQSKYGGASLKFDGTGDYLSTPHSADLSLISGDFTIELWVWVVSYTNASLLNKDGVSATSYPQYDVAIDATGKLTSFLGNGNGVSPTGTGYTGTTTITTGAWHHVAVVKTGSTYKGFLDGAQEWSSAAATMYEGSKPLLVGWQQGVATYFNGYLDDIRITKGIARYTAAFTPPTQAHPNSAPSGSLPATADWFADGLATWTSGSNDGLQSKVKTSTSGNALTLSLPMLATVTVGDTLTLVAGCQKRLTDCSTKFSNVLNFVGEPHLPGIDEVVR